MGQAVLQPAAASLEACSYSLAGLGACSGARPGPAARIAPHVRAGDPVLLAVCTRDRFGNAVPVAPGAIMAAANGPKGAVPFAPQEVRPSAGRGLDRLVMAQGRVV